MTDLRRFALGELYDFGDMVRLRVCPEEAGMVTGLMFRPDGYKYFVTWGNGNESVHYQIELTTEEGEEYNGCL